MRVDKEQINEAVLNRLRAVDDRLVLRNDKTDLCSIFHIVNNGSKNRYEYFAVFQYPNSSRFSLSMGLEYDSRQSRFDAAYRELIRLSQMS